MGEKERLVMREREKVMEGGMSGVEDACWTSLPAKMDNMGDVGFGYTWRSQETSSYYYFFEYLRS